MKYERPMISLIGNAQALVLGTKGLPPITEGVPPSYVMSVNAYEADE